MYLTISEVLGIMGKLKIFKSNLPNQKQSTRGEIYQIKSNQRVGKFTKSKAINAWGDLPNQKQSTRGEIELISIISTHCSVFIR